MTGDSGPPSGSGSECFDVFCLQHGGDPTQTALGALAITALVVVIIVGGMWISRPVTGAPIGGDEAAAVDAIDRAVRAPQVKMTLGLRAR